MLSGLIGAMAHLQTLRKHAAMIKSLMILKTKDIKQLDEPLSVHGIVYTLCSFLIELTSPLVPPPDVCAPFMFHSNDLPSSGQDQGKGITYFMTYHTHANLAECHVAILPALFQECLSTLATKAWFHPGALEALGKVTFSYDNDENQGGMWSTAEDEWAQDILDEDVGVTIELDNVPNPLAQAPTLLTVDDASMNSIKSALLETYLPNPWQAELAIPSAAQAIAASHSNGTAM